MTCILHLYSSNCHSACDFVWKMSLALQIFRRCNDNDTKQHENVYTRFIGFLLISQFR